MGKYLIANDRVLFAHGKEEGWVSWKEFCAPDFIKETPAAVLLTEVEFKKSNDPAFILPVNMAWQEESLKSGMRQSIGVRSDRLYEVLNIFPQGGVKVCVPYALSMRAFLIARGLFEEKALRIVIEDAGEMIFLTIFDGMEVVLLRMLSGLSSAEVVDELTRSLKRIDVGIDEGTRFIVNKDIFASRLIEEGVCSGEQVIVVGSSRMAFDALEQATFRINFLLPEQIARQQRKERQRRFIKVAAGAVLVVMLAGSYALVAFYAKKEAALAEKASAWEMTQAKKALEEKSVRVFRDVLGKEPKEDHEKIFQALLMNMPGGWKLEKVMIREPGSSRAVMEAVFSGTEEGVFACEAMWRQCHISSFFVSGRSWSVIKAEHVMGKDEQGE